MTIRCFADTRFPIERANGVQTMATCYALAQRGHDVRLVVRAPSGPGERDPFAYYGWPPSAGLHIDHVAAPASGRGRRVAYLFAALRAAIADARGGRRAASVVLTRDLGVASLLLRIPRSRRPPVVYEAHGVSAVMRAERRDLLGSAAAAPAASALARLDRRERNVWRTADAYLTITHALRDELTARFGPRERVFVVPDAAREVAAPPRPTGRPVAGYAGHLYPWKGVDVFVRALAHAPALAGLIVGGHPGEGDRARVDALAAEVGVTDRLTITGLVPPTEVRGRLAAASMLVLPNPLTATSARYTSPLKLFEYLTLDRPIVASDLPAIREILTDERTALLVPPGDPASLAAAMSRLAADPGLADRLARASHALAAEYTWGRRAERLEAALVEASA